MNQGRLNKRFLRISKSSITKASFLYNAAGDRVRMNLEKEGAIQLSRYYLSGQYELDIEGEKTKQRLYLGGTAYSAPAVYVNEGNDWNIYYICRDYLGSITHITNADGSPKEEYSYDAWGRLRDTKTHTLFSKEEIPSLFLARGYTGHEHMPAFGLINMNARLYDPMLGRFLSPDPYVQMPDFTQNFNRYSYCLNNPLMYVDENGESFIAISMIVGAAIFGYLGGTAANGNQFNPVKWDWKSGKTWAGIGAGAVLGAAGGYAFSVAAPWLASSAAMSAQFGSSYTVAAYGFAGSVFGGATGYATGYVGGNLYSNGDRDYSRWSANQFARIGTVVGAAAGTLEGLRKGIQKTKQENFANAINPQKPKWDGPYFTGTEDEARELLLSTSKILNMETMAYQTSRGYYFEKVSGGISYDFVYEPRMKINDFEAKVTNVVVEHNRQSWLRESKNNRGRAFRFTYFDGSYGNYYIGNCFQRARILAMLHTHPNSNAQSTSDQNLSDITGIPGIIFGWNGAIFRY